MWKPSNLSKSTRKNKKYKMTFTNPNTKKIKSVHFGSKGSKTFLDHNDEKKKENYIKRHEALDENWSAPTVPGTLSRYILWNKPTIEESLQDYLDRFF